MNVFLIAAITADGFIAENKDQPAIWSSKDDKKRFVELTKNAGVIVMGSRTFKTLPKPLKDRLNIVYTRTPENYTKEEGVEFTNSNPKDLISDLEKRGYTSVAICGGSEIYTLFMKSGTISKLYLTVEPLLFGSGILLFSEPFRKNLSLKESKTLENGTVFLEYDVIQ